MKNQETMTIQPTGSGNTWFNPMVITQIASSRDARFNTINQAVKYLDAKYGRSGWVEERTSESICIGTMHVYVQYGLRCDPDNSEFIKFKQRASKYPEFNIRLP